jgi:hypothetical protein
VEIDAALRASLDTELVHHGSILGSRQAGDIEGANYGHGGGASLERCVLGGVASILDVHPIELASLGGDR